MTNKESIHAVGDLLAFRTGYGSSRWVIEKISRITPSGRIVCGRYTLNPDLTIRGDFGYGGPYRAEPVTEEIKKEYVRERRLAKIGNTNFSSLSDESLEAVVRGIEMCYVDGGGASTDS